MSVLLLAATVCPAAISFVQQNSAVPQTAQSSVSVVYTTAQVAGDTNIVAIGWSDTTSSVTAVTDTKGNVYSPAVGPTRQTGIHSQAIYVAKNVVAAAAGANTVAVSFSAAVPYADVRILSYRGLDTSSPVEAVAGTVGTGTALNSGSVTTANANDLLFGASYVSTRVTAAGAGFTNRVITSPDGDIAEDEIVTVAGTYSATATITSGNWVMQLVALKAAAAQATAATPTFNPAPGTYATAQTVHLSDTTAGATISLHAGHEYANDILARVQRRDTDPGDGEHYDQGDGDRQRFCQQRGGDRRVRHSATDGGGHADVQPRAG